MFRRNASIFRMLLECYTFPQPGGVPDYGGKTMTAKGKKRRQAERGREAQES